MINKAVALLGTATLALRSRRKAGTAQRLSPLDNFFLMRLRRLLSSLRQTILQYKRTRVVDSTTKLLQVATNTQASY